jgi:hypothetical protein
MLANAAGLEPVGGRLATLSREVADGQTDRHTGHRERHDRPPGRLSVEPEPLRKIRVDPACVRVISLRNPNAAAEIGTPRIAASTSSPT